MLKKIFLIIVLQIVVFNCLYAGWPINRTPRIEGKVVDVTTGQPIENVVVFAEWLRSRPSPGGEVKHGIAYEYAVTNKEGKYKIPAKMTLHIISWFDSVRISILHPLYETKRSFYSNRKDMGYPKEGIRNEVYEGGKYITKIIEPQKGTIYYDVQLLSLEERYKEKPWVFEGGFDRSITDKLTFEQFENYVKMCNEKGVKFERSKFLIQIENIERNVERYDDEKLFRVWEEEKKGNRIYENWNKNTFLANYSKIYILKVVNKIKEKIREEK